jgi:hypothetical protein
MRKIILSAFLLLVVALSYGQTGVPDEVSGYIKEFQKAVLSHDYDHVMKYMDKDYVNKQCNDLLEKNKKQFIDEFFGGYENVESFEGYTNAKLSIIEAIDLYRVKSLSENEYEVVFSITSSNGFKYYCQCWLKKLNNKMGFFGAVG